jgi:hypothetical protein
MIRSTLLQNQEVRQAMRLKLSYASTEKEHSLQEASAGDGNTMKIRHALLSLVLALICLQAFQNCAKTGISIADASKEAGVNALAIDNPNPPTTSDPSSAPPMGVNNLVKSCADAKSSGKLRSYSSEVLFEDPKKTCDWGLNGNLKIRDGYAQARAEQYLTIDLPPGATVCNINLENVNQQNFFYDDNIILTLNDYILASTTNFSRHFTTSNGFYKYDWTSLVGKSAQNGASDTTPEQQYCAGKSQGLAQCLFPATETVGTIDLQFDERVIQTILGMTNPNQMKLGMITTGDNDSTDCQHVPVRLSINVDWY